MHGMMVILHEYVFTTLLFDCPIMIPQNNNISKVSSSM